MTQNRAFVSKNILAVLEKNISTILGHLGARYNKNMLLYNSTSQRNSALCMQITQGVRTVLYDLLSTSTLKFSLIIHYY